MSIQSSIVVAEYIAEKIRVAGGCDEVDLRPIENILAVVPVRRSARQALEYHLELLGCHVAGVLARFIEWVWHYGDGDWGSAGAFAAIMSDSPEQVRWLKQLAYRVACGMITPEWARTLLGRKRWLVSQDFKTQFTELFLSE